MQDWKTSIFIENILMFVELLSRDLNLKLLKSDSQHDLN